MEAKIIGLTDSTITFNEISVRSGNKLILHGKEEALVNLDTAVKLNEIAVLERCKLIKCIEVIADKKPTCVKEVKEEVKETKEEETKEEDIDETTDDSEEVEDAPTKKGRRGRPKGAKNKKTIKRIEKIERAENKSNDRTIVVNENGKPIETKTIKEDVKAPEESESTRASIEAMEEIEKEEKLAKEIKVVDESSIEVSNQMGRTATIHTGQGTSKVDMKNNFIPESEVAKNSDPFIDPIASDRKAGDETESFLDEIDENNENNDEDDAFIEI